jgi:hypothetical protein
MTFMPFDPLHDAGLSVQEQNVTVYLPGIDGTDPVGLQHSSSFTTPKVSRVGQASNIPIVVRTCGRHRFYHPIHCPFPGCDYASGPVRGLRKDHLTQHMHKKHRQVSASALKLSAMLWKFAPMLR